MEIPSSVFLRKYKPKIKSGQYATRTGNSHGPSKTRIPRSKSQIEDDLARSAGPEMTMIVWPSGKRTMVRKEDVWS